MSHPRGSGARPEVVLRDLELQAAAMPVASIPDLIGSLERLKATLWTRLMASVRETSSDCDEREGYLSVEQLCERIPYAESTIRNLMGAGDLREGDHYFRRRGRIMFSWPAMRRWVETRDPIVANDVPMARRVSHGR